MLCINLYYENSLEIAVDIRKHHLYFFAITPGPCEPHDTQQERTVTLPKNSAQFCDLGHSQYLYTDKTPQWYWCPGRWKKVAANTEFDSFACLSSL